MARKQYRIDFTRNPRGANVARAFAQEMNGIDEHVRAIVSKDRRAFYVLAYFDATQADAARNAASQVDVFKGFGSI